MTVGVIVLPARSRYAADMGEILRADLQGKVALVAGATRGAGRGIARALGEAGATVWCTGRSSRAETANTVRPETIEETAELVSEMSEQGRGIALRVDHTDEAAVVELCRRIEAEHGRLDVLVNDIWGGDALTEWGKPFWQLDMSTGFAMVERAVHTHVITARHAVPLLLEHGGLVVEVTDGAFWGYRGQLFYDLCKAATMRLAYAMAVELEDHPVTALAITPGFLRSEAVLDHFGVSEENWRDAIEQDPHFAHSETPLLVGRAIAALAADPDVARWAGQTLACWEVTRRYGVRDIDGRQPQWDEYLDEAIEQILADPEPSEDDLLLLRLRRPQLDFDSERAEQRAHIQEKLRSAMRRA